MEPRFTPEAHDALRRAAQDAGRRGDPVVTPDHLLLALLQGTNSNAGRLLARFRVAPDRLTARLERYLSWAGHEEQDEIRKVHTRKADEATVSEMLPRTGQVLNYAAAEAQRHGRPAIGTEHLLFGVAREGGSVGSWLLLREGLHPVVLGPELAVRLPEGAPPDSLRIGASISAVRAVNAVNGLALLGLAWTLFALLHLLGFLETERVAPFWPSFLRTAWAAGLALTSVRAGLKLERRTWPRMQALLFASSAGGAALLAAAFAGLAPTLNRVVPGLMFYLLLVGYLTVTMFRSRTGFGVAAREGWRTLWREGGIYLAVSAILELATLAGYILRG